jgi:hypothetical protein
LAAFDLAPAEKDLPDMPYTLLPSLLVRWAIVAVLSLSVCMPVVHAESGEPGLFEALGKLPKSATPPTEPAPLAESSPAPARTVAVPVQERRVALVMGNNAYQHVNAVFLPTPRCQEIRSS